MRAPISRCREEIMPSRTAGYVNDAREPLRAGKTGAKLGTCKGWVAVPDLSGESTAVAF
jgi:hypothetical protein